MNAPGSNDDPLPPADRTAPDERGWLVLAHLSQFVAFIGIPSLVGPLGVWLIKGSDSPVVAREAKEALNFALSLLIYTVGLIVLMASGIVSLAMFDGGVSVLALVGIGWLVMALGSLILPIIAAVQTSPDAPYRYPLTIRFFDSAPR